MASSSPGRSRTPEPPGQPRHPPYQRSTAVPAQHAGRSQPGSGLNAALLPSDWSVRGTRFFFIGPCRFPQNAFPGRPREDVLQGLGPSEAAAAQLRPLLVRSGSAPALLDSCGGHLDKRAVRAPFSRMAVAQSRFALQGSLGGERGGVDVRRIQSGFGHSSFALLQ